ncbi:fatty acid desaturase-domain-containing protein [Chytriomyces cf. hyalinus JEL632]|nr:fatty acid desaturase-domain-containing protein [Chytriomyces cf. hyalinus JEL632]
MAPPVADTAVESMDHPAPLKAPRGTGVMIRLDDIARRTKDNKEILIVFANKVYDLTKWAKFHPGGDLAVLHMNGRDATDAIIAYHPEWVMDKKMPHFCVGELAPSERSSSSKVSIGYRQLDEKIRKLGLYNTNYSYFIRELLKFVVLFVVGVYLVLRHPNVYGVLGSALSFATLWWQAAFYAHDAGHSGITHDRWTDTVMGICLGNYVGGLSVGWWKKNHNVHHIITNHPEHDPDIQHMPFMAVTSKLMHNLYSTYYKRVMEFDAVARVMIPIQHYTFYILLAFGRFNLYANSFAYLLSKDRVPHRWLELGGLVVFWTWYPMLLSTLKAQPGLIVMHVLVSHMFTVILHVQITLSHFGMDTSEVEGESFAEMALRTTMDVDCPRYMDWFHGGLQFQVVHHMFPRVPRHNLRTIVPLVKEFAREHGLTYHSYKFIKGNWVVLQCLAKVADEVRESMQAAMDKIDAEKNK